MTEIIRSSRQASTIFSLDGTHPPRLKNLFYVSFTRGTDTSTTTSSTTSSLSNFASAMADLGFLVKSTDRPQVQPITEELNQYGKKRIVQTGVRYSPVRIVFYDTTDSLAKQMFADYASNYFGAFGHGSNTDDYLNDTLTTFTDTAGTGWGFAPKAALSTNTDVNSQYYFRKISLYEVWGNSYTQTDIINPRITAFDPEGMSYEDSNVATISITLAYEAIVYVNNGATISMTGSDAVSTAFDEASAPNFWGDTVDYPALGTATATNNYTDYQFMPNSTVQTPYLTQTIFTSDAAAPITTPYLDESSVVTSGPLATYGTYDFGAGYSDFINSIYASSQTDLLGGLVTNPAVAAAINATSSASSTTAQTSTQTGVTVSIPTSAVASDQADVALASVMALASTPAGPDTSFYAQKIAAGAMSAAAATKISIPREQIFTTNPATAPSPNSWDSTTLDTNGIALSSATYEAINGTRPASSQIGFNTRTLRSQSG